MDNGGRVKPIYAQGFFYVHESGLVDQLIVFDYEDPDRYYAELIKSKEKFAQEIENLWSNMQYYLDQEKVIINGEEALPTVINVDVGFRGRFENPYILFYIVFKGELRKGLNTYENYYEEEAAEYDYTVTWFFPLNAKVVKAEVNASYVLEANGRILFFKVRKGTKIGGREKIVFEIK